MSEDERRDDLRRFLRERRARITPDEADLPPGRRSAGEVIALDFSSRAGR
jgi:hypothetical protein